LHFYFIQVAANAVALLSTVGNVVFERHVQSMWRARLNSSGDQPLANPNLKNSIAKFLLEQGNDFIKRILEYFGIGFKRK